MEEVCDLLDQPVKMPKKNWVHLGNSVGVDKDILNVFSPLDPEEVKGPTEALFNYLKTQQPRLVLSELVVALYKIECPDALDILGQYLPGVLRLAEEPHFFAYYPTVNPKCLDLYSPIFSPTLMIFL